MEQLLLHASQMLKRHTCPQLDDSFLQIAVVPSKLAVTRAEPAGDQDTDRIVFVCVCSRTVVQYQIGSLESTTRSHNLTVLSPLQLAKHVPVQNLYSTK